MVSDISTVKYSAVTEPGINGDKSLWEQVRPGGGLFIWGSVTKERDFPDSSSADSNLTFVRVSPKQRPGELLWRKAFGSCWTPLCSGYISNGGNRCDDVTMWHGASTGREWEGAERYGESHQLVSNQLNHCSVQGCPPWVAGLRVWGRTLLRQKEGSFLQKLVWLGASDGSSSAGCNEMLRKNEDIKLT